MNLETTRFGQIEVDQEQVITFPKGIPSFEEYKQFALLPADEAEENPFYFLQSVEEASLCFFLLDPFKFFPDYQVELDEPTINDLEIDSAEDVLIFTMVTAKGSLKEATTNLRGPIVINLKKRLAKQTLLEKGDYLIKQPLFAPKQDEQASQVTATGKEG